MSAEPTDATVSSERPRELSRSETDFVLSADSDLQPALSVVMPTLNEEAGVVECIDRLKSAVEEMKIPTEIIISDSSTDRTPELARENGAIVAEPDEPGYGYAYRYAFERARGEYIAIGDADTTYDFEELPKLFELVSTGDADMVMGSRLDGDIKDDAMPPLHQYIGNPLLTRFLNAFYDAGVSDAHSGMRVFTREAWETMDCDSTGMEFASEMIMEAGAKDLDIAEVPITYHAREGEANLESFPDGWRHVRFMLLNAPGYLFSIPGLVAGVLGILVMGLAYSGVAVGGVSVGVHSMIAGSLLTLVGYQIVNFGLCATVASDPIRRPNDPVTSAILDGFSLERAATVGIGLFTAGAAYAAYLASQWVASGFTQLPLLFADILAFTAIVVGLQTVFGGFFMSSLAD